MINRAFQAIKRSNAFLCRKVHNFGLENESKADQSHNLAQGISRREDNSTACRISYIFMSWISGLYMPIRLDNS